MNISERANEPTLLVPNNDIRSDQAQPPVFLTRLFQSAAAANRNQNQNQGRSQNQTQQGKQYSILRTGAAAIKLFISFLVIAFTETKCDLPLRTWLIMMMIYDSLILFAQYLKKIAPSENNNTRSQQGYELRNSNQHDFDDPESFEMRVDEESGVSLPVRNRTRRFFNEACREALLNRIQVFATLFYIILWIYGQMLFWQTVSNCETKAPYIVMLIRVYLVFQYITFVLPFCFVCCAVVILFIVVRRYPRLAVHSNQVPATNELINTLPVHKYPTELPGDHECRICMCGYSEEEEIIQLRCSNMHHFHAKCIKQWLHINGVCPICRTKLGEVPS